MEKIKPTVYHEIRLKRQLLDVDNLFHACKAANSNPAVPHRPDGEAMAIGNLCNYL